MVGSHIVVILVRNTVLAIQIHASVVQKNCIYYPPPYPAEYKSKRRIKWKPESKHMAISDVRDSM